MKRLVWLILNAGSSLQQRGCHEVNAVSDAHSLFSPADGPTHRHASGLLSRPQREGWPSVLGCEDPRCEHTPAVSIGAWGPRYHDDNNNNNNNHNNNNNTTTTKTTTTMLPLIVMINNRLS